MVSHHPQVCRDQPGSHARLDHRDFWEARTLPQSLPGQVEQHRRPPRFLIPTSHMRLCHTLPVTPSLRRSDRKAQGPFSKTRQYLGVFARESL